MSDVAGRVGSNSAQRNWSLSLGHGVVSVNNKGGPDDPEALRVDEYINSVLQREQGEAVQQCNQGSAMVRTDPMAQAHHNEIIQK